MGLTCDLGYPTLTDCKHYNVRNPELPIDSSTQSLSAGGSHRLPWSGRALGLNDIMLASARSSPVLIGLIGPFNAGKTAFLTSLYAHFCQTGQVGQYTFAGSYTLQAWESLKSYAEWPNISGPGFPPHTPDSGERVPSLLHLALRKGTEAIRDILFTDVPGEWFSRWQKDQDADNAQGARWIADRSSHFLFFVDRLALSERSTKMGMLRQETLTLARVLSEQMGARPITAVWTKSDLVDNTDMEIPVRQGIARHFGKHHSVDVRFDDGSCLQVLNHVLQDVKSKPLVLDNSIRNQRSAFWQYKGK